MAKLKLSYFGHVTCGSVRELALTVSEGNIETTRHQGKPRRQHGWTVWKMDWEQVHLLKEEMSVDKMEWQKNGHLSSPTLTAGRPSN